MQHGVTGPVCRGAGPLHRRFTEIAHVAAKGALVDLALVRARKWHAHVLKLNDRRHRLTAHVFDGVLVAKPVGTLDRVVHVPFPVVLGHVAERCRDTTLGRHRVGPGRENLGDTGRLQARRCHTQRGAKSCTTCSDDDDFIFMVNDFVRFGHGDSTSEG